MTDHRDFQRLNWARYESHPTRKYVAGSWWMRWAEIQASWIAEHAPRSARVLDVAGGVGAQSGFLVRLRPDVVVYGVDISMAQLKERSGSGGLRISTVGTMEELPFSEAAFDMVLYIAALHHSANPAGTLREASRVLRPGGSLALIEPVSLRLLLNGAGFAQANDSQFRFSLPYLLQTIRATGFTLGDVRTLRISARMPAALGLMSPQLDEACYRFDRLLRRVPLVSWLGAVCLAAATRT